MIDFSHYLSKCEMKHVYLINANNLEPKEILI